MSATQSTERHDRRSRSAANRRKILDAAQRLFLKEGYSGTRLEQVADAAGVTKPTIYNHFQSKEGLFNATIDSHTQHRLQELSAVLEPSDDVEKDLIRVGDFFLSHIFSPRAARWDRLAAAESLTHPELGRKFFQAGPEQVVAKIAGYLQHQDRSGRLRVPDPPRAAEQLIGMFLCLDLLRTQIGQAPPTSEQQKRQCRDAVAVFLKAYGVNQ